ncbi:MAG: hypothetical protein HZA78_03110 [Candidatus Schekmanbacteria bacterium]|nr:hypothetical protein [Candidatus Schekmanbacteria bacterium]
MARPRSKHSLEVELDSFLDIMTNCIGILVIIVVLAMINSSQMTFIFRTPLARKSEKEPLFFECSNGRVAYIDKVTLDKKMEEYRQAIHLRGLKEVEIQQMAESKLYKIESEHYQLDLERLNVDNLMVLVPRKADQGESVQKLDQAESAYKKLVKGIDTEKNFVFFIVRPDSFDVFRKARKLLWDSNIQAGWEPLKAGRPITFGSVGRQAVVD